MFYKFLNFHNTGTDRTYSFEASSGQTKEAQQQRIRICIAIKHWLSHHWEDFDEALLAAVQEFLKNSVLPVITSSGNIILQLIEKKVRGEIGERLFVILRCKKFFF